MNDSWLFTTSERAISNAAFVLAFFYLTQSLQSYKWMLVKRFNSCAHKLLIASCWCVFFFLFLSRTTSLHAFYRFAFAFTFCAVLVIIITPQPFPAFSLFFRQPFRHFFFSSTTYWKLHCDLSLFFFVPSTPPQCLSCLRWTHFRLRRG